MNILCVDYGEKYCGLAMAVTFVAEPLEVVKTEKVFERLAHLIVDYQILKIVVGLSESLMAEKTRLFAQQLKETYHLPIIFQDETLTSQDTRRELARLGAKRSLREGKTDHYVAAVILQDYLDSQEQEVI